MLCRFVHVERELPAQHIHGWLLGRVGAFAAGFPDFGGDGVHVGAGDGRVHGGNVHHASGFHAVQPDVAADRSGVVKLQDKLAVGGFAFFLFRQPVFAVRGELSDLPLLALVFAEILDNERFNIGDSEQAFARGVDGEASKIAGNPTAVELFGDGGGGAGTAEAVEDDVAFVGGNLDDAVQKGLGFLGRVIQELRRLIVDLVDVCPDVLKSDALIVTLKAFKPRHALLGPMYAAFCI